MVTIFLIKLLGVLTKVTRFVNPSQTFGIVLYSFAHDSVTDVIPTYDFQLEPFFLTLENAVNSSMPIIIKAL